MTCSQETRSCQKTVTGVWPRNISPACHAKTALFCQASLHAILVCSQLPMKCDPQTVSQNQSLLQIVGVRYFCSSDREGRSSSLLQNKGGFKGFQKHHWHFTEREWLSELLPCSIDCIYFSVHLEEFNVFLLANTGQNWLIFWNNMRLTTTIIICSIFVLTINEFQCQRCAYVIRSTPAVKPPQTFES